MTPDHAPPAAAPVAADSPKSDEPANFDEQDVLAALVGSSAVAVDALSAPAQGQDEARDPFDALGLDNPLGL